eukprot:7255816-Pyramimonas_sp.AAC.1
MEEVASGSFVGERLPRKPQAGAQCVWGPHFMLVIRAGHGTPEAVVTFRFPWIKYREGLRRELRLRMD